MINLFTSYYKDKNKERQKELDFCLKRNIENKFIDNIYLLSETEDIPYKNDNMTTIFHDRPTYSDFFREANKRVNEDDVVVLTNSDIFLDETIKHAENIQKDEVYTLLRWNYKENGSKLYKGPKGTHNSQDTWIWRGKMVDLDWSDFNLGVKGCDNRIAWEFKNKGYKVKNPALTIKTYHVHQSGVRYYKNKNGVPGPHYGIMPHK